LHVSFAPQAQSEGQLAQSSPLSQTPLPQLGTQAPPLQVSFEAHPQSEGQLAQSSPLSQTPLPQLGTQTPPLQVSFEAHPQSEGQLEQSSVPSQVPSPQTGFATHVPALHVSFEAHPQADGQLSQSSPLAGSQVPLQQLLQTAPAWPGFGPQLPEAHSEDAEHGSPHGLLDWRHWCVSQSTACPLNRAVQRTPDATHEGMHPSPLSKHIEPGGLPFCAHRLSRAAWAFAHATPWVPPEPEPEIRMPAILIPGRLGIPKRLHSPQVGAVTADAMVSVRSSPAGPAAGADEHATTATTLAAAIKGVTIDRNARRLMMVSPVPLSKAA
jgi:hypothetical protein